MEGNRNEKLKIGDHAHNLIMSIAAQMLDYSCSVLQSLAVPLATELVKTTLSLSLLRLHCTAAVYYTVTILNAFPRLQLAVQLSTIQLVMHSSIGKYTWSIPLFPLLLTNNLLRKLCIL